jgi:hypothetical protein
MGTLRVICLLVIVWDAALHFDGFGSPERPVRRLRGVSALTQLQRARRGICPLLLAAVCHSSMQRVLFPGQAAPVIGPKRSFVKFRWPRGRASSPTPPTYTLACSTTLLYPGHQIGRTQLCRRKTASKRMSPTTARARYGHRQLPASAQLNLGCILPLTCECRIPEHQDFVNGHQLKMQKENQIHS